MLTMLETKEAIRAVKGQTEPDIFENACVDVLYGQTEIGTTDDSREGRNERIKKISLEITDKIVRRQRDSRETIVALMTVASQMAGLACDPGKERAVLESLFGVFSSTFYQARISLLKRRMHEDPAAGLAEIMRIMDMVDSIGKSDR